MSNAELILGGLKLLVFGMGMVFVFLVVMIIAMNLMQKILAPFAAAFEPAPKAPAKPKAA
ncbi:OadG family transporter subunit, partial [uncultured Victivallis sp.]